MLENLNNMFSEAIHLHKNSEFESAEKLYNIVLSHIPTHADALHLLGVLKRQQGDLNHSLQLIQSAISYNPKNPIYYSNIGNVYRDLGDQFIAEQSYLKAIEFSVNFADPYCNLGVLLLRQRRFKQAEIMLRKAISLNSRYLEAYNNLGYLYKEIGQIDLAIQYFNKALELCPDNQDTLFNLGNISLYNLNYSQAVQYFNLVRDLNNNPLAHSSYIRLAILHYLNEDYYTAQKYLCESKLDPSLLYNNHVAQILIYRDYLEKLINWHINHKRTSNFSDILHVVGESHALSVVGLNVRIKDECFHTRGWWIEGCKQWHLGTDKYNRFKYQFEQIMTHIPPESNILITIGEIDSRIDEGIIKEWKKDKTTDIELLIDNTVRKFVYYCMNVVSKYNHNLFFSGVPAVNSFTYDKSDLELQYKIINILNCKLEHIVKDNNHIFINTFSNTNDGSGRSNKLWHIDEYHLSPSYWENIKI